MLGLTERQEEVLRLIAKDKTTNEIAEELKISTETVKEHIATMYRKLGVSSRTGAALFRLNNTLSSLVEASVDLVNKCREVGTDLTDHAIHDVLLEAQEHLDTKCQE